MKCINKKYILLFAFALSTVLFATGCGKTDSAAVLQHIEEQYDNSLFEGTLKSEGICVSENDVALDGVSDESDFHAVGLFDMNREKVLYADSIHEKLYPASLTKLMTALVALEHGNLDDEVVVSRKTAAASFPIYAQVCGLKEGDVWSLRDLLYALLLYSGNDAASTIAEHIASSEDEFVKMMNDKSREILATNTHFMNPHGLHDDNHYTTAYDLYLIFNECLKHDDFVEMISQKKLIAKYKDKDGNIKSREFQPTNLYAKKAVPEPANATIVGGKTGTTDEAGNCLILLEYDKAKNPYVSIVMGANGKSRLYQKMTSVIEAIPQ